ncbi:MAG: carboxymuconolactone decarboxylase family protein [Alphaproteobacteria bacterium]|nr:MAG: carboxymuconolactone decarboxylase family protein [Alphaproteobacteria bacterium]
MTTFKVHTPETAPEKSRPILKELNGKLGFVPNVLGVLSESPAALKGWVDMKADFESGTLSNIERKIIHMTTSCLNDSTYCVAAGTTIGEKEGVPRDILNDLREDRKLKDAKLEQLRLFTKAVMRRMGRPEPMDIEAFRKAGYTNAHVLEVVLGVSLAIMGNYVGHIAQMPLDKAFEANKYEVRRTDVRKSDAA